MTSNGKLNIVLHVLAALTAAFFVMSALPKISGDAQMVAQFETWGFPAGFVLFIGLTEALGAVALVIPKTRFFGAVALAGTMVGAIGTHVLDGHISHALPATVFLLLTGLQAWTNRPSLLRFSAPTAA